MSFESALIWSVERSVLVAAVSLPLALAVCTYARSRTNLLWSRLILLAGVSPLFVPDLLTGFTYRLTSARLLQSEVATEALYSTIMLLRVCALQILAMQILPRSTLKSSAAHTMQLLPRRDFDWWRRYIGLITSGPARSLMVTWSGGFLFCFQEFETAALLQIETHPISWTVWLFDAQAAGEPLRNSLQRTGVAVILQLCLLTPAFLILSRKASYGVAEPPGRASVHDHRSRPRRITGLLALCFCLSATAVMVIAPLILQADGILAGMQHLLSQSSVASRAIQILTSLVPSVISATLALFGAFRLRRMKSPALAIGSLLPGLMGPLSLSVCLLTIFQWPLFNSLYDTMAPMLLGQTLFALPRAYVLVLLLEITAPRTAVHSARLLSGSVSTAIRQFANVLLWRLHRRRWILALAILTHWTYWDVTIISLLRPVSFEPVVTRLYNEMHYGRTESLVALTTLAVIMPVLLFFVTAIAGKMLPQFLNQTADRKHD